jgi:hypothetical protein
VNSTVRGGAISRAFGPARPLVPGLVVLAAISLLVVGAGMYNVVHPPFSGDRTIMFMLALGVYPAPYLLYGVLCFVLFHHYTSSRLTLVYYVSCLLLVSAPAATLMRHMDKLDLPFPRRLHQSTFENFLAALVIGAVSLAIMIIIIKSLKWLEDDSD